MSEDFIEDEMREVIEFFSRMMSNELFDEADLSIEVNGQKPVDKGFCNCCFGEHLGFFLTYQYEDGVLVDLFICSVCSIICSPESDCKLDNRLETLKYYDTQN